MEGEKARQSRSPADPRSGGGRADNAPSGRPEHRIQ